MKRGREDNLMLSGINGLIRPRAPLSECVSFRTGGAAEVLVEPQDLVNLKRLLKIARVNRLPWVMLGGGNNVLIRDSGVRGLVIRLTGPDFCRYRIDKNTIKTGAGLGLNQLLALCIRQGLGGLEFLAGIPGTVGGAVVTNAGTASPQERSIADCLKKVKVIDNEGKLATLARKDIKFTYRGSSLKRFIVLEAEFNVKKNRPAEIRKRVGEFLRYRRKTQGYKHQSAGCVFKNPSRELSAGKLIELAGLKNLRHGGAYVSRKHANFIITEKNAKSVDVLTLVAQIQQAVASRFGLELEPEIKILGR